MHRLLWLLQDAGVRSGEELGRSLGVSRSAVWNAVRDARLRGVEVDAVPGRGYRLKETLDLLSAEGIVGRLSTRSREQIRSVRVACEVDSTSSSLLRESEVTYAGASALLSEYQTAGRGRRGRSWVAPYGANINLSLLWRFDLPPVSLMGLSVAIGVAVAKAVEASAAASISLKWPNDLYLGDRKLGGILIDLAGGEACGPCNAVIGVGVNVAVPAPAGRTIEQPWVDLRSALGGTLPSRDELASEILEQLVVVCDAYQAQGLAPFLADWHQRDWLQGRLVDVQGAGGGMCGIARGVDALGALQVESDGRIVPVYSGELSVRVLE